MIKKTLIKSLHNLCKIKQSTIANYINIHSSNYCNFINNKIKYNEEEKIYNKVFEYFKPKLDTLIKDKEQELRYLQNLRKTI